jgi:hypothetical protein
MNKNRVCEIPAPKVILSVKSYGLRNITTPATNAAAMTMITTQTQMEALASFLSSISSPPLHYFSDPTTKKPLPKSYLRIAARLSSLNLQKYKEISGPGNFSFKI